jgi:hypothetical protein
MIYSETKETRWCWKGQECCSVLLSLVLLLGTSSLAEEQEGTQYFKMISSIEYTGKGQYRNQVETLFTVRKQALSDNKVQYSLSLDDLDPNLTLSTSSTSFSFILDRTTRNVSGVGQELAFWARVNNESLRSLTKVTKDNVGKTWKQSIDLSSLGGSLPPKLAFTLTATELKTEVLGDMIAVRALSEPFFVKTYKGSIRSRINATYLFDPNIEDVYLSISVFEAATSANGFDETLRHEVATYKTDATGTSVDLSGLGAKFEKLAREVGLSTKGVKVVEESPLPAWARSEGLAAAQVANICVAVACEGALNPVVTVCIPAARMVTMQSLGQISSVGTLATGTTVAASLAHSVPGIATMKIAMAPAFAGWGLGTAGTVAAGTATAGGIAIAENNSNGGGRSNRSPTTP